MSETLFAAGLGSLARMLCMRNCLRDTVVSNTSIGGQGTWRGYLKEFSCRTVPTDMSHPKRSGGYFGFSGLSFPEGRN